MVCIEIAVYISPDQVGVNVLTARVDVGALQECGKLGNQENDKGKSRDGMEAPRGHAWEREGLGGREEKNRRFGAKSKEENGSTWARSVN